MAAVGVTPGGPVVAEDIRDLQSWPCHEAPTPQAGGFSVSGPGGGRSRSSGLVTARRTLVATCV